MSEGRVGWVMLGEVGGGLLLAGILQHTVFVMCMRLGRIERQMYDALM